MKNIINNLHLLLISVTLFLMFALPKSETVVTKDLTTNHGYFFKDNDGLHQNIGLSEEGNGVIIIHLLQGNQNNSNFFKKINDFSCFVEVQFQKIAISFKNFEFYTTNWIILLSEKELLFPFHFFF